MKCENCGKNEVTFVYRSNINGQVEEKRLCGECAEKLGYAKRLANSRTMMRNFFAGDPFFGNRALPGSAPFGEGGSAAQEAGNYGLCDSIFPSGWDSFFPSGWMRRMLDNPFDDFFMDMPALSAPIVRETEPGQRTDPRQGTESSQGTVTGAEPGQRTEDASAPGTQPEENRFMRWRKLNALKAEMRKAVHREDFERAAQIRDEIRQMEGRDAPRPQGDA